MQSRRTATLSIVSHGQGHLIRHLLEDLQALKDVDFDIVLTLNIPEDESYFKAFPELPIRVIRNSQPKGFGANHNAASAQSTSAIFVIVNPDIRMPQPALDGLLSRFDDPRVGACAPLVRSGRGTVEDSARRFPTFGRLASRTLLRRRTPDYAVTPDGLTEVDWVAGMFVAYRRDAFEAVKGFDERYFMYLEDADICRRLHRVGWNVKIDTGCSVIHDAQRASRKSLQHMRWHARSAVRFLTGI